MSDDQSPLVAYLAGPMRGYPRYNFDAFDRAAEKLRTINGLVVVSPAEMDRDLGFDPDKSIEEQNWPVSKALRRDFIALLNADAVILLDGWENSDGACKEAALAVDVDIPLYELSADLESFVAIAGNGGTLIVNVERGDDPA